jgi:acyl-CoA thioester hydrolase
VTKHRYFLPLSVRYVEVDSQQHVFFGHYLTYFDLALVGYMRAVGYAYQDMMAAGVDMFYVHASCDYEGRARFEDLLRVHARIGHVGNTSFTFEFAVYKQPGKDASPEEERIATGKIVAVAVDVETEEPIRVPDALREAVARFEGR